MTMLRAHLHDNTHDAFDLPNVFTFFSILYLLLAKVSSHLEYCCYGDSQIGTLAPHYQGACMRLTPEDALHTSKGHQAVLNLIHRLVSIGF